MLSQTFSSEARNPYYFGNASGTRNRRASSLRSECKRKCKRKGFTLIELMIVISIIAILMSVAAVQYRPAVASAKETVLREDLHELRRAIDMYTEDKRKSPQSLDDLVSARYLRAIPKDPITNQPNWQVVYDDTANWLDQTQTGIFDVHSSSNQMGSDDTPYSSW